MALNLGLISFEVFQMYCSIFLGVRWVDYHIIRVDTFVCTVVSLKIYFAFLLNGCDAYMYVNYKCEFISQLGLKYSTVGECKLSAMNTPSSR